MGLKVDGFMRPGGPTERALNANLAEDENKAGLGEGETPPPGSGKGGLKWPGDKMPVYPEAVPQWYPFATMGPDGPRVDGPHPKGKGFPPIRPPKGPY